LEEDIGTLKNANNMAYDIIGNVNDSSDNGIKDVVVSDGVTSVKTNEDGYYELKTEKGKLTFSKNGYNVNTFDLTKYKNPSSVNVDITLNTKSSSNESTNPTKPKLSKKTLIYVGVGLVVLVGGYFIYKKYKK
jgi:hypothetical protein